VDTFSDPAFDLPQRLRTHICYAHVFGDALTEAQLVARCAPDDPRGVGRALELLESTKSIQRDGDYWFLSGGVVAEFALVKQLRERAALRVLEEQRVFLAFLQRLRVVRMLAVSGSVGWRNQVDRADRPADLDLFVITAPSGVHIVRFIVRVREGVRWLLSRVGWSRRSWARVCANYVTEIRFLDVTNPSFYTASDALNVQILKGEDTYRRFLGANRWIERYYPASMPTHPEAAVDAGESVARAALNLVCFGVMAAYKWTKGLITGQPFDYCIGFRFDRTNSLVRSAAAGGGYQPTVARRFSEIHERHFGSDAALYAFLFPGTTHTGVFANGEYAEPPGSPRLGYDE
jgi:hypothetical protein